MQARDFSENYFTGKDMCKYTGLAGSRRKGFVRWPDTAVGSRRSVRCPYAYDEPVFVWRDCVLVETENSTEAVWSFWSSEQMDVCPDSPFSRQVKLLYDQLVCDCFVMTNLCDL